MQHVPAAGAPDPWILKVPGPGSDAAKLRLFCLPQAGSGAWVYQEWHKEVPPQVQVMPVELPGRNSRMRERKPESMGELVDALLAGLSPLLVTGAPFALFGHSLGAWVAYAAAQELHRRGGRLPARLYVSGMRSPVLAGPEHDVDRVQMHTLKDPAEFWAAMERRYGRNPDLEDPAVRKFVLPLLQTDFKVAETYRPGPELQLPCPIVALGSSDDPRYTPQQLEAWQQCATPGLCRTRWFAGGHNYLFREAESKREFLDFLAADLRQLVDDIDGSVQSGNGVVEVSKGVRPGPSVGEGSAAAAAAGGAGAAVEQERRERDGVELPLSSCPAYGAECARSATDGGGGGGGGGGCSSMHSSAAADDACSMLTAATLGSTGSASNGRASSLREAMPPSAAAMSRVGRKVSAASAALGEQASPKWQAPAPQRGCLDCVFLSWRH